MAQGLKGLNQGGGYDWETPYLSYLKEMSYSQKDQARQLFQEYKFAKDYIVNNNINLLESPMEDFTSLFHTIYTKFGQQGIQQPQAELQPQQDSTLMTLDNITPDVPELSSDNLRPLDQSWMEEVLPYIHSGGEINTQSFNEYIGDVGKKIMEGTLSLPNDRDFSSIRAIKDKAWEVSPEYRMRGEESKTSEAGRLKVSDQEWLELGAMYDYLRQTEDQETADQALAMRLKDMTAKQQGFGEQLWRGFRGMGSEAAGAIVMTLGSVGSIMIGYPIWGGEDVEGLNGWQNYWDKVLDNPVTRYGKDVIEHGTLFPEQMKALDEIGVQSKLQIYRTHQEENGSIADQVFNWSTIPYSLQQYGFTLASMLAGAGEAKIAGGIFKGLGKGATRRAAMRGITAEAMEQSYKGMSKLGKAQRLTYGYVIPAMQGTSEGFFEGLDAKDRAYESGMRELNQIQEELYQNTLNKYLQDGTALGIYTDIYKKFHEGKEPLIVGSIEDELRALPEEGTVERAIRDQAVQAIIDKVNLEYQEKFDKAKAEIEYLSARAGLHTVTWNSAINGIAFMTGKAALTNPRTQKVLAESKIFGWTQPRGVRTNKAGKFVPKYGIGRQAWDVVREPVSEFVEEYSQNVTQDVQAAKSSYNVTHYLDRLYNQNEMDDVGTTYTGQHAAALAALGESMVSKESFVAGIYGLISSAMGGPGRGISNNFQNYRTVDAQGNSHWDVFSRRQTSEGQQETFWQHMGRINPWRSGLAEGIDAVREKKQAYRAEAEALNEWFSNEDNLSKFKNISGSVAWAKELQEHAYAGDEFGYRNSNLGKAVNDAFMLGKLKKANPGMYKSLMDLYQDASTLVEGTEQAEQFMEQINAGKTQEEQLSLKDVKQNAREFLEMIEKVQKEDQNLRRTFGDLDEDVRQTLVYGRLAMEDFNERGDQLESEIATVLPKTKLKDTPNTGTSAATEEIQRVMSKYGNTKEALEKSAYSLRDKAGQKDTQARKLRDEASKAKTKAISEDKKAQARKAKEEAKALRKEAKQIDQAIKLASDLESGEIVMSESQILESDPITRANYLNPNNIGAFTKAQQDVIRRVTDAGQQAIGSEFLSKVLDNGKLSEISQQFLTEYSDLLSNPNSLKFYANHARRMVEVASARRQGETMAQMQDYSEFAEMLDKLRFDASPLQQSTVFKTLKELNSDFLDTYMRQKADSDELLGHIRDDQEFQNMFDDQKALMSYAVNYLANNPLDGNRSYRDNIDQAVSKLLEKNPDGTSKFQKYVESVLPGNISMSSFDFSDENIASLYRQLVEKANKNREDLRKLNETPEVSDSDSNPTPPITPDPTSATPRGPQQPNIFRSKTLPTNPNQEVVIESPEEAQSKIAQTVESVRARIAAYPKNKGLQVDKQAEQLATEAVDSISLRNMLGPSDFLNKLSEIATQYSASTDVTQKNAADILNYAVTSVANGYTSGGTLQTLDITSWANASTDPNDPNYNWIKELIVNKQIYEFLRTNPFDRHTPIYFYTSGEYKQKVRRGLAKRGSQYTINDMPVIAVIEVTSEEDKKFAYAISSKDANGNSVTKYYRPIGVLPSSSRTDKPYQNAAKFFTFRQMNESADEAAAGRLLVDTQGNLITSTSGIINGENPSNSGPSHHSFDELFIRDFMPEGQSIVGRINADETGREFQNVVTSPEFAKAVKEFFEKAFRQKRFTKQKSSNGDFYYLAYTVDTLFNPVVRGGNTEEKPKFIGTKSLSESKSAQNRTLLDTLQSGNVSDIQNFNSRTNRYVRKLTQLLKNFNKSDDGEVTYVPIQGRGTNQIVNSQRDIDALQELGRKLGAELSDYLIFTSDSKASYNIVLRQTSEEQQQGQYHYELIVNTSGGEIVLGTIWESALSDNQFTFEDATNLMTNLLLNDNRTDLRRIGEDEIVRWGFKFGDFLDESDNKEEAARNRMDIITDNILYMSVNGLVKQPSSVTFQLPQSPLTNPNSTEPAVTPTDTTNPANATSSNQQGGSNDIHKDDGTVIDPDGPVIEKGQTQEPQIPELVGQLDSFAKTTNANTDISVDGKTLVVSGTESYSILSNLLGLKGDEVTIETIADIAGNKGMFLVDTPMTVKGELSAYMPNGEPITIKLADQNIHLVVRPTLNDNSVGLMLGVNSNTNWSNKNLQEYVATIWEFAEQQLGMNVDFMYLTYQHGAALLVSRANLPNSKTGILGAVKESLNVASNSVTTTAETLENMNPGETVVEGGLEGETKSALDFTDTQEILDTFSEETKNAPQETAQPAYYTSPQLKWGVWDRQDGTQRTAREIESIMDYFKSEYDNISDEKSYYEYLSTLISSGIVDEMSLQDVMMQEIECHGI